MEQINFLLRQVVDPQISYEILGLGSVLMTSGETLKLLSFSKYFPKPKHSEREDNYCPILPKFKIVTQSGMHKNRSCEEGGFTRYHHHARSTGFDVKLYTFML